MVLQALLNTKSSLFPTMLPPTVEYYIVEAYFAMGDLLGMSIVI